MNQLHSLQVHRMESVRIEETSSYASAFRKPSPTVLGVLSIGDAPLLREVEAAKPKAKAVAAPPVRLASSAQAVTDVVLEKQKKLTS